MCFCDTYKNSHKILCGTILRIKSENPNDKEAMVGKALFLILEEACFWYRRKQGNLKKTT